ncbi:MAG TPA: LEA type 2 family protein [Methanoregula sp.]|nr:LEA type 2 family protein [Methanoregula sp.]
MRWYHTAGACLLIISCVVVAGCSLLFKNPDVSVTTVTPTSLSLSAISLNVTLHVDNPNPIGIPFKKIAFDAWFHDGTNWNAITHAEQGAIEIKPGKTGITIPVSVRYTDMCTAGWSIISRHELPLKISGTASPDFFGIAPELPFTYNTTIPLALPGI